MVELSLVVSFWPTFLQYRHDFDWLSASVAVGAQFNYFSETNSGSGQMLSAVLGQIEFPRVHLSEIKMFSTFSMYYEFSLWFIPSDVAGESINSMVFQFAFGLRTNIF